MKRPTPTWALPDDFAATLDDEGIVEIGGWEPIEVTAMSGTASQGRDIPIAWQIEILASGEDGYAVEDRLLHAVREVDSALAARCHSDTEAAACVLWVETETDCRTLLEICWPRVVRGA